MTKDELKMIMGMQNVIHELEKKVINLQNDMDKIKEGSCTAVRNHRGSGFPGIPMFSGPFASLEAALSAIDDISGNTWDNFKKFDFYKQFSNPNDEPGFDYEKMRLYMAETIPDYKDPESMPPETHVTKILYQVGAEGIRRGDLDLTSSKELRHMFKAVTDISSQLRNEEEDEEGDH